jgi:hypothetical protein
MNATSMNAVGATKIAQPALLLPGNRRPIGFSQLTSSRLRQALDLRREPMAARERYGMTLFGQAALVARRLVEAGTRFVSVFWDEYGLADSAWTRTISTIRV